jgi:hypothetical protein
MSAPPGFSGPDYLAFLFSVSHRSGRVARSQTSTSGLLTTKRLQTTIPKGLAPYQGLCSHNQGTTYIYLRRIANCASHD